MRTLIFPLTLLVLIIGGCFSKPDDTSLNSPAPEREVIKVGVSPHSPPLIFKNNGTITGLEASLAHRLATYLNKNVEFIEVPWSKQIDYLNQGKTDIVMSGMTITKQRKYLADFSLPYLKSGQILLVRLADAQKFSSGIYSIMNSNYKVGTVTGTTGDLFVTATLNKINKKAFKTSSSAVDALVDKDIDVLVYDAPMVCYYAATRPSDKLYPIVQMATSEHLAWAVRKNNPQLKSHVDTFLKTIKANGILQKEITTWIPYLK